MHAARAAEAMALVLRLAGVPARRAPVAWGSQANPDLDAADGRRAAP